MVESTARPQGIEEIQNNLKQFAHQENLDVNSALQALYEDIRGLLEANKAETSLRVIDREDNQPTQRQASIRTGEGKNIAVHYWQESNRTPYFNNGISAYDVDDGNVHALLPDGEMMGNVSGRGTDPHQVDWHTVDLLLNFQQAVSQKRFENIDISEVGRPLSTDE